MSNDNKWGTARNCWVFFARYCCPTCSSIASFAVLMEHCAHWSCSRERERLGQIHWPGRPALHLNGSLYFIWGQSVGRPGSSVRASFIESPTSILDKMPATTEREYYITHGRRVDGQAVPCRATWPGHRRAYVKRRADRQTVQRRWVISLRRRRITLTS